MKERIEELANQAVSNSLCAGEPHYIKDAITTAVNEALEMAANEFGDGKTDTWPSVSIADEIRKLKV